jgi:hypothetical protein
MTVRAMSAQAAYVEAAEQLVRRATGRDRWSDRAVFWTAVRYGAQRVGADTWSEAATRWTALWEIARSEHLAPIPGVPEVEQMPVSATAAERGIAQARAIVGREERHGKR